MLEGKAMNPKEVFEKYLEVLGEAKDDICALAAVKRYCAVAGTALLFLLAIVIGGVASICYPLLYYPTWAIGYAVNLVLVQTYTTPVDVFSGWYGIVKEGGIVIKEFWAKTGFDRWGGLLFFFVAYPTVAIVGPFFVIGYTFFYGIIHILRWIIPHGQEPLEPEIKYVVLVTPPEEDENWTEDDMPLTFHVRFRGDKRNLSWKLAAIIDENLHKIRFDPCTAYIGGTCIPVGCLFTSAGRSEVEILTHDEYFDRCQADETYEFDV